MIQDATTVFTLIPPAQNVVASASNSYDLNADFGAGQNPRKAPYPGIGEDILMRCDVTVAWESEGAIPAFQFHLVLSDVSTLLGANMCVIGTSGPSQLGVLPGIQVGWSHVQLALGVQFYIRANPWTAPMGILGQIGKDLRYFGLVCVCTNYAEGGPAGAFASEGQVKGYFVKQSDIYQPASHLYPSAVNHVG